ncbi:hypothetical protein MAP00_003600 [Monascus purpureus]|nr:hypothetical protein MAP00_003600 [Monascus purpureus]
MPSYFYHIALELQACPQSCLEGVSGLHQDQSQTSLSFDSACEALLPFQKRPVQSRLLTRVARQSANDKGNNRLISDGNSAAASKIPSHPHHNHRHHQSNNPLAYSYSKSATSVYNLEKDLRLDKVVIECIDMVSPGRQDATTVSRRPTDAKRTNSNLSTSSSHNNPVATGIGTDILGGLRTKGRYIPLDRKTSDSVWGIVHLYRDVQETPYLNNNADDYAPSLTGSAAARHLGGRSGNGANNYDPRDGSHYGEETSLQQRQHPDEDCTTLCILAVPSYMSPSDLLGFVGEKTMDDVSHFRMIKTARANRYMVLMKFRSGKKAREWQSEWNGKVFNSMEPETCHVVFVKTVEIQLVDPDTQSGVAQKGTLGGATHTSTSPQEWVTGATSSPPLAPAPLSTKPLAPRTPALIELPTCPVCLERMDETSGLLTIICQHVFHCTCLQKWKGSGCPVCRYTQDDFRKNSQSGPFGGDEPAECSICHSELNLWICLICGNVGCGRYDGAHAFAHFKETSHAFAMDLATQRVWDYVGDAYVHRIIQSKTDGKLVELPAADNSALDPPDWSDAVPREKLENMSVEYTHLLISQLESQRAYFEEIVERAADKASQASTAASSAQVAAQKATDTLTSLQSQYDKLTQETLPTLERDKSRAEKRAEKFESMARKMEKEWREEKTMNESLMQRITFLSNQVEKLEASNKDLEEQNRDLTFFISGSERLKGESEDIIQGTISVPGEGTNNSRKKKGKGRK